jgi:two-component system response regulator FlrC
MTPAATAAVPRERPFAPAPVAESPAMREVLQLADDVAPTPTTVLLLGESGSGKEILARHLHAASQRARGPWVAVNCAALPAELLESELFGHERGAFTGATERRAGRFEQATGGTLLLDEISELPLPLQAKLLRVLQEREVDRVGGQRPVAVDARIVATTNRDLAAMVRAGSFRSDLYYRLNVFPIVLPPLRDRPEDVLPLAERLLDDAAAALGREPPPLSEAAREALLDHPFPGNVRELRNLLERALVRCRAGAVEPRHLGLAGPLAVVPESAAAPADGLAPRPADARAYPEGLPLELAGLERLAIEEALRRVDGNRTHAARLLGIGLRTLRNKLREAREAGAPLSDPLSPCVHGPAGAAARPIRPGAPAAGVASAGPIRPLPLVPGRARASQEERA